MNITNTVNSLYTIIDELNNLKINLGKSHSLSIGELLYAICLIVVLITLAFWINKYLERKIHNSSLDGNTKLIITKLFKTLSFLILIICVLPILGINITTLSVFTGGLGVGLGIGLQKMASNFIGGFFVLFDKSIKIGDLVVVDSNLNISGIISQITTRYVKLKCSDGTSLFIPNDRFMTGIIQNKTPTQQGIRNEIIISLHAQTDLNKALSLISSLKTNGLSQTEKTIALINKITDRYIEIKIRYWILDSNEQDNINNQIYIQLQQLFQAEGIKFADNANFVQK